MMPKRSPLHNYCRRRLLRVQRNTGIGKSKSVLNSMKFFFLIIGFIAAGTLAFQYLIRSDEAKDLGARLANWGVAMNVEGFQLPDFSQTSTGGLEKETLEAESNKSDLANSAVGGEDTVLQMTRVRTEAPQKYINDKKFLLESLFLPTTSPYPGTITNVSECPEDFRPREQTHENGSIYTLFAGGRLNYGVCAQDLVEYYSAYGIFDCKEKGIFEVRVFSKNEDLSGTIAQSFTCHYGA